jgi:hypothetical protein
MYQGQKNHKTCIWFTRNPNFRPFFRFSYVNRIRYKESPLEMWESLMGGAEDRRRDIDHEEAVTKAEEAHQSEDKQSMFATVYDLCSDKIVS